MTSVALVVVACAATKSMPELSLEAIDRCLGEMMDRTGRALSPAADRAYVYARGEAHWIYFTHGDSGTFGTRSEDYRILLTCGTVRRSGVTVVFLGETMEDPIVDTPDRGLFVTPEGSTELLFERTEASFEYCCSQAFDRRNIGRNGGSGA